MITLGVPVEPELQTPQPRGGTTSGSGVVEAERLSSMYAEMIGVHDELGLHGGQDTSALPLGKIPTHRHHRRTRLPAGEARHEVFRRVADAHGQDVAHRQTLLHEHVGQLRRALVQLTPRHLALGSVFGREDHADPVGIRLCDPVDLGAKGHALCHDRCHLVLPFTVLFVSHLRASVRCGRRQRPPPSRPDVATFHGTGNFGPVRMDRLRTLAGRACHVGMFTLIRSTAFSSQARACPEGGLRRRRRRRV